MKKLPDQIIRISIIFTALILFTIVIRVFIIPEDLKEKGIFRTSAIKQELAKEIHYAGSEICVDCHEEQYDAKHNGYHKELSCEVCHGPSYEHSEEPDDATPDAPRKRKFCPVCHTYNLSRPSGFPQINPFAHNPLEPCINCHEPHDPRPPETPEECSGCHRSIATTLAVSPHVKLECITCHNTPEDHKINPRVVRPGKPTESKFCGKCHADGSSNREAPKIDISVHGENGEKYLCWQCHYPHLPEVD